MTLCTSVSGPRRGSSALQATRDFARRHALAAWVVLALGLAAILAPRFWVEIRSLLAQPGMCASEPAYADLAAIVAETQSVYLVTDRSPERSTETLFCTQFALAPRPVIRRFTNAFDPTWSPSEAILFVVDEPALLSDLVSRRERAIEQVGHHPHVLRKAASVLVLTIEPATP